MGSNLEHADTGQTRSYLSNGLVASFIMLLMFVLYADVCVGAVRNAGPRLWTDMEPSVDVPEIKARDRSVLTRTAVRELSAYWHGGDVLLSIDNSMPDNDGFRIEWGGCGRTTVVKARRSPGLLYGAYELLRVQQTSGIGAMTERVGGYGVAGRNMEEDKHEGGSCVRVTSSFPAFSYRLLEYNDRIVEGANDGCQGNGMLQWDDINGGRGTMGIDLKERIIAYARANASIGINGCVLNGAEVATDVLNSRYINKVRAVAGSLRPYGIRAYLSVSLDSPVAVGGLATANPLDASVKDWWKKKIKEIYAKIPDFGGFIINADYAGLLGPDDYGHSCADGVNLLANLLAQYGGIVVWRGSCCNGNGGSVMPAVTDITSIDGLLASNVIMQLNPFSRAFQPIYTCVRMLDGMEKTPAMIECRLTDGFSAGSDAPVSFAQKWKEFFYIIYIVRYVSQAYLSSGSPDALAGAPDISGLAGTFSMDNPAASMDVSHVLANWYAFGRLAWNPTLRSDSIARELLQQTSVSDTVGINRTAFGGAN